MAEKLPILWNAHWASLSVLLLASGTLIAQAHPNIDYGEAEWGLITLVARELLHIATKIADHYTGEKS